MTQQHVDQIPIFPSISNSSCRVPLLLQPPNPQEMSGVTCMDWLQQWWSEYWALKNASAAGAFIGLSRIL